MQAQQPSPFPRVASVARAIVFALAAMSLSACAGFEWPTAPRGDLPYLGGSCERDYERPAGERAARRGATTPERTGACTRGGSAAYDKTMK